MYYNKNYIYAVSLLVDLIHFIFQLIDPKKDETDESGWYHVLLWLLYRLQVCSVAW